MVHKAVGKSVLGVDIEVAGKVSKNRSSILRYGIALLAFGAALFLTKVLWPLTDPASTPLFFAAVMVAAYYGGLVPGLLATVLSTWADDFFFIPPINEMMELNAANLVRAGVFMLVAIIISSLSAARKKLMDDLR